MTLEYSGWWVLLGLVLSAGLAALLYTRNYFGEDDSKGLRITLAALRGVFIFVLFLLLLGPLLKTSTRELEKATVVVALDNSESMLMASDSISLNKQIENIRSQIKEGQNQDVDLHFYRFGDVVKEEELTGFSDKVSNLSRLLEELDNRYENRHLAAVVVVSDGLFNQGANPEYYSRKSKAPLFAIGLGDTLDRRDLKISAARHNDIAYLGNTFPIQVDLEAVDLDGSASRLKVMQGELELYSEAIQVAGKHWQQKKEIRIEAKAVGTQQYKVIVEKVDGEYTAVNNQRDIFIDVLDARTKVVIIGAGPHPDIGAFRRAIESNEQYQVETHFLDLEPDFRFKADADLVILHNVPSLRQTGDLIWEAAAEKQIPVLFVTGQETYLRQLGRFVPDLQVIGKREEYSEVLPWLNESFDLFQLSDEAMESLKAMPPLWSPYGEYSRVAESKVLLKQRIGSVVSDAPLLAFTENQGQKLGVLFGEGFWRWSLYDFDQHENHNATNELWSKIVQYLALKTDKRPFRVKPSKKKFVENEVISFEAEYYNAAFQLQNEADVKLTIRNAEGQNYAFQMGRNAKAYRLDAGYFPPGQYTFTGRIDLGAGKVLEEKGVFSISPLQLEANNLKADFKSLERLALKNGGKLLKPEEAGSFWKQMENDVAFKPVSYLINRFEDLINLKWLFWTLLLFISTEWVIRKLKSGSV
ncbi:MAG: VWA domain-containing protein [Bacteroidetes bacterium]|nr:MAG: VWA domain-containing protein [Bacteroidota bacterium]